MRSTLPAPAQPEEDVAWMRQHRRVTNEHERQVARQEYLYWQRQEDALDEALALGYNQHQGFPGEVFPYRPDGPGAHLNPRLEQMEALARWAAADKDTRGQRPSVDPNDAIPARWTSGPLPYKCGLADLSEREDYGEPG